MTVTDLTTESQVTLVAASGDAATFVEPATDALAQMGAQVGAPQPLAQEAVDIPFSAVLPQGAEEAVRQALGNAAVDVAAQPARGRRKRLLVADMESTMIQNEMLDELADLASCRTEVEGITAQAMNGEIDFRASIERRVALLKGLPATALEEVLGRVEETAGAKVLVATLKAHGVVTALVSGGFDFFAERMRQRLGFDVQEANELEIEAGCLTGRLRPPIRARAAKLRTLKRLIAEHGLRLEETVAVGDGANDLDILTAAGLGVAFHAKPAVAHAARFRIEHCDLTALLFFQGYRQEELKGLSST
jgi:phosphoserine phosphatase